MFQTTLSSHAIVIGSSIAGMAAARVLSNHFDHVTVIERDQLLLNSNNFRKGVPQARHPHLLMLRGQEILEEMFPGMVADLLNNGADPINLGTDWVWHSFDGSRPHFESDIVMTACSRPLLENAIARRLVSNPKITVLSDSEVVGLCVDETKRQITGVMLVSGNSEQNPLSELKADLVIDASGRSSKAPEWLKKLGFTPPQETKVNAFPGYATRIYERPAGFKANWKVYYIQPTAPNNSRGAVLTPLEGNRWHVCLIGMNGDYPPTDEAGFMEFLRNLPDQSIYQAIQEATPLTSIYGFRQAENRLRHYDAMPNYLENFLVFGDAVYALNPVYGQGMTIAAIGSQTLDACLRKFAAGRQPGLAAAFQKELGKVVAGPWQLATGEDMRWSKTEGAKKANAPTQLIQNYFTLMLKATLKNTALTQAFYKVQQMIEPPTSLLRPGIVWQVLRTTMAS